MQHIKGNGHVTFEEILDTNFVEYRDAPIGTTFILYKQPLTDKQKIIYKMEYEDMHMGRFGIGFGESDSDYYADSFDDFYNRWNAIKVYDIEYISKLKYDDTNYSN